MVAGSQGDSQVLKRGTIFMKEEDILLTGDKWTIVVTISTAEYDVALKGMKTLITHIDKHVVPNLDAETRKVGINDIEIQRIKDLYSDFETQVQSFKKLLPPKNMNGRSKRGLINLGGKVMKVLFGTMDSADLESINKDVTALETQQDNVIHALDQQVTVIKQLDGRITDTIQTVRQITTETIDAARRMSIAITTNVDAIQKWTHAVMTLSSQFRNLEFCLIQAQRSLDQVQESIDVTSLGRLSHVLVTPHNLTDILRDISLQLPRDITLLTLPHIDVIHVYYELAKVHAVAMTNGIRVFIEIPLRSSDRNFQLYQIRSFPYYHEQLGQFVTIQTYYDYIAISEDKQFYALLTPADLQSCVRGSYTVCAPNVPLYARKTQSCETALLFADTIGIQDNCVININHNFRPQFHKSPKMDYWIFSVQHPTKIVQRCVQANGSTSQTTELVLKGTGILKNSGKCYVHSEHFKLLPTTNRFIELPVNHEQGRLIIPPLVNDWTLTGMLDTPAAVDQTIHDLNEVMEHSFRSAKSTSLSEVTRTMNTIHLQKQVYSHVNTGIYTSLCIFLVIILAALYCCRNSVLKVVRQICRRRPRGAATRPVYSGLVQRPEMESSGPQHLNTTSAVEPVPLPRRKPEMFYQPADDSDST